MDEAREQPKQEPVKDQEKADALLEDILHRIRAIRFCVECMAQRAKSKK